MPTTKTKTPTPVKKTASAAKSAALAHAPVEVSPAQLQLRTFEAAVRLFSAHRFEEAITGFTQAVKGPAFDVADRARGYLRVCERRLAGPKLEFQTADDHFNYAVERLNARDFEKARSHLSQALKMQPKGDHILYTLAISCGLAGDGTAAYENLKRAIEIEPRNRVHARQDSDFAAAAERFPELRTLI